MNKLLFPDGGVPFRLTDLSIMQKAYADAFAAIVKALQKDGNVRLFGCKVTRENGRATWTSGAISIGGEIYTVAPGGLTSKDDDELYWVPNLVRTDATLQDGTKKAIREENFATMSANPLIISTKVKDSELKDLYDCVLSQNSVLAKKYNFETYDGIQDLATRYISLSISPDGTKTINISLLIGGKVTLQSGYICKYKSVYPISNSFYYTTLIDATDGLRFKPVILALRNGAVYLYDVSGNPITGVDYACSIDYHAVLPDKIL